MSTTLVRNGTIVTASDRYDADIYIDKGVITLIGRGLSLGADSIVDAAGCLVMPGGIDVHTHLDMPFGGTNSADDFQTGTVAAAHGGTTTLVDFAIQDFGSGLYPACTVGGDARRPNRLLIVRTNPLLSIDPATLRANDRSTPLVVLVVTAVAASVGATISLLVSIGR